jgi:hypothetical protein
VLIKDKSFYKQINIYPTFKFTLYRTSSLELYFEIIEIAFIVKTLKENLEYLDYESIKALKEELDYIKENFDISRFFLSKTDYFLGREFVGDFIAENTVYLIIDSDMQPIYDLFKKFDRIKYLDEFLDERVLFYNSLVSFKRELYDLVSKIPEKKRKKLKKFSKLLKEIKNGE